MERLRRFRNPICILSAVIMAGCSASGQDIPSGQSLYLNNCAACHGVFGEGDGPVASVLRVSLPNLRTLTQRSGGTFPSDTVTAYVDGRELPAAHGDRNMPIWGDVFAADEGDTVAIDSIARARIDAVIEYLMQLQYRD